MSSLSVTILFSPVSGGPSRGGPMTVDISYINTESTEKSSWAVDSVSRNNVEPVASSSSSLSAYEEEEVREADYAWVDNWVQEVFSKFRQPSML